MSSAELRAVVFDVDGTLADTERDGHRPAFNEAFAAAGLPYRWDEAEYGELLAITGGRRRIEHYLRNRDVEPQRAADLAAQLHEAKTARFVERVRAGLVPARAGVADLLGDLRAAGLRVAVATTGKREWVSELLDGLFGLDSFEIVITGTEVTTLKPPPTSTSRRWPRCGYRLVTWSLSRIRPTGSRRPSRQGCAAPS